MTPAHPYSLLQASKSENLLNEAMRVTHTETQTAVIVLALEELIHKAKIAGLKQFKGKIAIEIDLGDSGQWQTCEPQHKQQCWSSYYSLQPTALPLKISIKILVSPKSQ
ncbi:MAG: type II toxin-antitoxin system VapB family antitoxin [Nitrosomonas sp.]|nr:type II toxin-antitoxin system VapB family antitoxin [Nitrosomonas sp.]MCP5251633.1 type II toxin-antitoxin system VapB family antitoxin [Burkholderiales bacterium]